MSWTEERVERLSRLWLEGRSASQIAGELGEGVTRNAVIGKVHRLGLSGRDPAPVEAPQLRAKATLPAEPIALPRFWRTPFRRSRCAARAATDRDRPSGASRRKRRRDPLVGPGHDPRTRRHHVPLAARRPDDVGVPFLRVPLAQQSPLLRRTCPDGVPARRGSSPRRTHGPDRLRAGEARRCLGSRCFSATRAEGKDVGGFNDGAWCRPNPVWACGRPHQG